MHSDVIQTITRCFVFINTIVTVAVLWQLRRLTQRRLIKMPLDFTALQADVEDETTVDGSAEALIDALAKGAADTKGDQAKLDAFVAQLQQNKTALAAAVQANTPAATPPTV